MRVNMGALPSSFSCPLFLRRYKVRLFKDAPQIQTFFYLLFFSPVIPKQMHMLEFVFLFFKLFLRRGARNDSQLQHRGTLAVVRLSNAKKRCF